MDWRKKTEDTGEMVLDVNNKKSNTEMSQIRIGWSNRLGKRNDLGQKPRAIIVKFTQYIGTHHVFGNKNL